MSQDYLAQNYVEGLELITGHLRCWTDYPLHKQRRLQGEPGSVYIVNVLCYDGDKYVKVETDDGHLHIIKAGYLRTDASCLQDIPPAVFSKVPISRPDVWGDEKAVADSICLSVIKRAFL